MILRMNAIGSGLTHLMSVRIYLGAGLLDIMVKLVNFTGKPAPYKFAPFKVCQSSRVC